MNDTPKTTYKGMIRVTANYEQRYPDGSVKTGQVPTFHVNGFANNAETLAETVRRVLRPSPDHTYWGWMTDEESRFVGDTAWTWDNRTRKGTHHD